MPKIEVDGHRSFTVAELELVREKGWCKGCGVEPRRRTSSYGEECAAKHRASQGVPVLGEVPDRPVAVSA